MNFENQTRMITMREKNPKDTIHLIYDSSLLNEQARIDLHQFCEENSIVPVDADSVEFKTQLQSEDEKTLYKLYKDEITHLKEGGNLGVASDILRWLPPCYHLGSYTDLDVPLDTSTLPDTVSVDSPLLLNIGSLKLFGNKEMVLTLNEFIGVVDEQKARPQIEKVHKGMIRKLTHYENDYIEKTVDAFSQDSFLSRYLVGAMKNRAESTYIQRSTLLKVPNGSVTSRGIRAYINEVMTDPDKYINFHRKSLDETDKSVVQRLRNELGSQLGIIKWLFFRTEYNEIKKVLSQNDDKFIATVMKKERSLYLKSIVICTTGPIEVANSLFGDYTLNSDEIDRKARPAAFSHYGLHKGFLSKNVVPLHQNIWGMLRYLGADVGELNDSSWLEEGMKLQESRLETLLKRQKMLAENLPSALASAKEKIEDHIRKLQQESQGFFGFFYKSRRQAKIKALQDVLNCFNSKDQTFDIVQFKGVLEAIHLNEKVVYGGLFSNRTQRLVEGLAELCHEAVVYRVARDKKPKFTASQEPDKSALKIANLSKPQNQTKGPAKIVTIPISSCSIEEQSINSTAGYGVFFKNGVPSSEIDKKSKNYTQTISVL